MEKRKEIWIAISSFYLDTELQESDYLEITKIFKLSKLSIDELKAIDTYEVFPALQINMESITGEWTGFNEEWLIEICTKNYKRSKHKIFRFITNIRNKRRYWMRKEHWEKVEKLMREIN